MLILSGAPFVPKKFAIHFEMPYSMTPELLILIDAKEKDVAAALDDDDDDKDADEETKGEDERLMNGDAVV